MHRVKWCKRSPFVHHLLEWRACTLDGNLTMMRPGCPSLARFSHLTLMICTHFFYLPAPSYAVPWAATVISHYPSFLTIYGLFFLTRRDIDLFFVVFAMAFVDCMREINEQWDMLVCCIRNGVLPDLDGIDQVREHLQASSSQCMGASFLKTFPGTLPCRS